MPKKNKKNVKNDKPKPDTSKPENHDDVEEAAGGEWQEVVKVKQKKQRNLDNNNGQEWPATGGRKKNSDNLRKSEGGFADASPIMIEIPKQQQQVQRYSNQSTTSLTLPTGPGQATGCIQRGTIGAPGTVWTNYVTLDLKKMPSVAYHYNVVITPELPKRFIRPAFEKFNNLFFPNNEMAFDGGKNCYTVQKLPVKEQEKRVEIDDTNGRNITFNVAIKETENLEVDLDSLRNYSNDRVFNKPMRALQVLDVVLANACHGNAVRVGRSYYIKPQKKCDLRDGYEMWTGMYMAAILGDRPYLNIDISHTCLLSEMSIIQYVTKYHPHARVECQLDYKVLNALRSFTKNMSVIYTPPKCFSAVSRRYRVDDITAETAVNIVFTLGEGIQMNVAEYFKKRGYELQFPNWNCVVVGTPKNINYLPLELCLIPSGQIMKSIEGTNQVQQMIKFSATSTNERKDKILNMLNHFNHNADKKVRQFMLSIGREFIEVPTRLLRAPMIEYFASELIRPTNGYWRLSRTTKFLDTKTPKIEHKWAIIFGNKTRLKYCLFQNMVQMLNQKANHLNIPLNTRPLIESFIKIDESLGKLKQEKYDFVIVILPFSHTTYADVKQSAELRHGILTQCIKEGTLEYRCNDDLMLNILIKINAKLNGTNHKISKTTQVSLNNVMYLGADVTHPSPDQSKIPSVVGVAASHDQFGACYNRQFRLQTATVEAIEDMATIIEHHLRLYFKHQKKYPDHVIYYRDGVSDGQFPIIRDTEIREIRRICKKKNIHPKITCIVVVKRHHTRFFPKTSTSDKFNNVPPGTVVDRIIVHPNEMQWFMVSHKSVQGTARPTRYNVIVNDANLDINLLQTLTYNMCHMFPRCNRAVSYPAPVYLAHLVAFRGRIYLSGSPGFGTKLHEEYAKRLVRADLMEKYPMFFI